MPLTKRGNVHFVAIERRETRGSKPPTPYVFHGCSMKVRYSQFGQSCSFVRDLTIRAVDARSSLFVAIVCLVKINVQMSRTRPLQQSYALRVPRNPTIFLHDLNSVVGAGHASIACHLDPAHLSAEKWPGTCQSPGKLKKMYCYKCT